MRDAVLTSIFRAEYLQTHAAPTTLGDTWWRIPVLVLSAAALIGRSLIRLEGANLEIDAPSLLVGELTFRGDQYETSAKQLAMVEALTVAVRALPGVTGASPAVAAPYGASVAEETSDWRQAYATVERFRRERPPNWARLPWA